MHAWCQMDAHVPFSSPATYCCPQGRRLFHRISVDHKESWGVMGYCLFAPLCCAALWLPHGLAWCIPADACWEPATNPLSMLSDPTPAERGQNSACLANQQSDMTASATAWRGPVVDTRHTQSLCRIVSAGLVRVYNGSAANFIALIPGDLVKSLECLMMCFWCVSHLTMVAYWSPLDAGYTRLSRIEAKLSASRGALSVLTKALECTLAFFTRRSCNLLPYWQPGPRQNVITHLCGNTVWIFTHSVLSSWFQNCLDI